jgi:hypothetical protein
VRSQQRTKPLCTHYYYCCCDMQIDTAEFKWDRYVASAQHLEAVTKADVLALHDDRMLAKQQRRRMDVLIHGNAHPLPDTTASTTTASTTATAAAAGETLLELTPEQLLSFREGLTMMDTSLDPRVALEEMLASRGSEIL